MRESILRCAANKSVCCKALNSVIIVRQKVTLDQRKQSGSTTSPCVLVVFLLPFFCLARSKGATASKGYVRSLSFTPTTPCGCGERVLGVDDGVPTVRVPCLTNATDRRHFGFRFAFDQDAPNHLPLKAQRWLDFWREAKCQRARRKTKAQHYTITTPPPANSTHRC